MSTAKLLDGDLRILIMPIKIENTRYKKTEIWDFYQIFI